MMIGHKKISRKKPGTASTKKYYFDENTQDAIVRFQQEKDKAKRNLIYTQEISPAFNALVENLINVYKFQASYESKNDLKNACIEDLYGVIEKYDVGRGSKAFAYFNVVAKNWLTIRSKQNAKNIQTFISLDDKESFTAQEMKTIENYHVIPACDEVITSEEFHSTVRELLSRLDSKGKTENEHLCINAINEILNNIEKIEFINKRAVMAYLREITKLSPKQLSVVLSSLKKYYKDIRKVGDLEL